MEFVSQRSLTLRPLELADFPQVLLWNQDTSFCEVNEWPLHREEAILFEWWKQCVETIRSDFHRIGIEWDNRLIGYVDFAEITDDSTELGIAIGDSTLWQKGLGSAALAQALEFGKTEFKIHSYTAETHVSNTRAQNMLQRFGFVKNCESANMTTYILTLNKKEDKQ